VTYRLVYTHRAIKDIDGLDASVKQRIGKALRRFEQNPLAHANRSSNRNWAPIGFKSETIVSSSISKTKRSLSYALGIGGKSTNAEHLYLPLPDGQSSDFRSHKAR
jgi:hypothetical protein